MKLCIHFFILLFLILQVSCSRRKALLLTSDGVIKKNKSKEIKFTQHRLNREIEYFLNYEETIGRNDTAELRLIADKFISEIKKVRSRLESHFKEYQIVFENDTNGHLKFYTASYRDFSAHLIFNLNKQQMHYYTQSGF